MLEEEARDDDASPRPTHDSCIANDIKTTSGMPVTLEAAENSFLYFLQGAKTGELAASSTEIILSCDISTWGAHQPEWGLFLLMPHARKLGLPSRV